MRLTLTAIALVLMFAGDAAAATRSVARLSERPDYAIAGDAAVILQTSRRGARVVRVPFDPTAGRSTVFRFRARDGLATADLAASADLLAVGVVSEERDSLETTGQEFTGPPLGPLTAFGPPRNTRGNAFLPVFHEVDGDRLITTETRGVTTWRWVIHEQGAPAHTIQPPRDADGSDIAGDLVALLRGDELVVRNWRTGARLATHRIHGELFSLDLRADGAIVVGLEGGDIVAYMAGAPPRRIARHSGLPTFAGDRIVFVRQFRKTGYARLQVRDPNGRVRPIGVPSATMATFEVDEHRVLWQANGCLLTAPLAEPSARAPEPGVCPRSEMALPDEVSRPVGSDRRVLIRADCVAAAPPACRGTLTVRGVFGRGLSERQRFRIPVGRRGRLKARLTRRGYAAVKRMDRQIGGAGVEVRTVSVDPDGRRRVQLHRYIVDVPPQGVRSY